MFDKILVPTDFSAVSHNALHYAVQMALRHQARLVLLHVCKTGLVSIIHNDAKEADALRKMRRTQADINAQYPSLPEIEIKVLHARGVSDEIVRYANRIKASAVVMGFKGSRDDPRSTLGKNTLEVIMRCPRPVFSIPKGASFQPYQKIAYTNYNSRTENTNFNTVVKLAEAYQAEIIILRTRSKREEENFDPARNLFSHKKNIFKYQNIRKEYVGTDDLKEGTRIFTQNELPELMALGIHDERFFYEMVLELYRKDIAFEQNIPLMSNVI
jgi:nucleotide-binding universal stress UspA family protein